MVGGDTLDILSSQFYLYFSYTLHFSQFASLLQVSPYFRANLDTKISHLKTLDSLLPCAFTVNTVLLYYSMQTVTGLIR